MISFSSEVLSNNTPLEKIRCKLYIFIIVRSIKSFSSDTISSTTLYS